MTSRLLRDASLSAADVVEFAPGLGRTATEILRTGPKSYLGIERDPDAARIVGELVVAHGECRNVDATATGLPDASADVGARVRQAGCSRVQVAAFTACDHELADDARSVRVPLDAH